MKNQILKLKQEKAQLVSQIRELKSKRKELRGYVPGLGAAQWDFRIKHIAHCLLRGRTMEQIEGKYRDPNDYSHKYVQQKANELVVQAQKEFADEAIRTGA